MYQRIGPILSLFADRLGTTHFRVAVDERVALQEDFSGRPLASPKLPPRVTVREHGIRYRIHFEEGHKTGFFCDQRDNRRDLARFCPGRTVLDLCCYTGGFGLNALIRGEATRGHVRRSGREGGRPAAKTATPIRSGSTSSMPTPSATCARWASTAALSESSCSTRPS